MITLKKRLNTNDNWIPNPNSWYVWVWHCIVHPKWTKDILCFDDPWYSWIMSLSFLLICWPYLRFDSPLLLWSLLFFLLISIALIVTSTISSHTESLLIKMAFYSIWFNWLVRVCSFRCVQLIWMTIEIQCS